MLWEDLNTCLGVELNLTGEQTYSCRYCILSKKDKTLNIEDSKIITGSLAVIIEALPKTFPVALCLTGKGIVHKNITLTPDLSPERVFQNAFPSVDQQDFYVQQFNQDQQFLISIVRRTQADELVDKLKRGGLSIYALSLGAIVTTPVWTQLNIYGSPVIFDGHEFTLTENKTFVSYRYEPELKSKFPVKIEQELVNESILIAYAAAFQLILHDKIGLIKADTLAIDTNFEHFLSNAKLKKQAIVFLFSLFGLLLISFILFSYYNQENAGLSQQVGEKAATADQTALLSKNNAENEQLLKVLNWNGGYNYGFLLNEIGKSAPKQVKLIEITANDYKTEQEKATKTPNIKIVGQTADLSAVNNWIFLLKEKEWIKSVKLLKYQENDDAEAYLFNLEITY